MAQQSVSKLTAEKKVETKKINPTASLVCYVSQRDIQKGVGDPVLVIQSDGGFLPLLKGDIVCLVWTQPSDFSSQGGIIFKLMPYGSPKVKYKT